MLYYRSIVALVLAIFWSSTFAVRLDKDIITPLEVFVTKNNQASLKNSFNYMDVSVDCGLCGIAVNEIEGCMAENLTETEMELQLDTSLCSLLSGDLAALCYDIIDQIPVAIGLIEKFQSVGVTCVEMGLCAEPFMPHSDPQAIPTYVIDLDLPPEQRWAQVCSNSTFQSVAQYIISTIQGILPDGGVYLEDVGELLNEYYFPSEYAAEIRGCAAQFGIPYGWLTLLNMAYELTETCTSIIAQAPDGKILHARNLDFADGMGFTASLKDLAVQANFQKDGKPFFYTTTFAGFVGVLSGMKPNGFSVTIDTRFYPQGISQLFYEAVAAMTERNASLVTFLSRDVFTNENTFEAALQNLATPELIADVYYIIAGTSSGEGAVISRNRHNATDIWRLDPPTRWFEVATNYDHWEQPPWYDDRVKPATEAMNAIGQNNVTLDAMFKVLSMKPVINLQTTYSILTCPADGTYHSFARYCQYPCAE